MDADPSPAFRESALIHESPGMLAGQNQNVRGARCNEIASPYRPDIHHAPHEPAYTWARGCVCACIGPGVLGQMIMGKECQRFTEISEVVVLQDKAVQCTCRIEESLIAGRTRAHRPDRAVSEIRPKVRPDV
ncbi:hypothetical protein [Arthrobacter sp. MDT2-2]